MKLKKPLVLGKQLVFLQIQRRKRRGLLKRRERSCSHRRWKVHFQPTCLRSPLRFYTFIILKEQLRDKKVLTREKHRCCLDVRDHPVQRSTVGTRLMLTQPHPMTSRVEESGREEL